jgi:4-amino-4-deoxy-L-arabinose transferase-like glycosyltransferase
VSAVLVILVFLVKLPILHVPPYWDEMSWVSQARWLSETWLIRALPGLRPPDLFFGHPPGLHFILALLAKIFGYSVALSHLVSIAFAALGVCFTYHLGRLLYDQRTGLLAAVLLLLSPLYFAQAGMFLGDVPVAALGVTSVYCALRGHLRSYLACACAMVLIKETAVAVVVALTVHMALETWPLTVASLRRSLRYAVPLAALGLFVVWQKLATGHFLFIYDPRTFDIALVERGLATVFPQLMVVTSWLFVSQGRWVLTALIGLHLLTDRGAWRRSELRLYLLIILLSGYSFGVLFFLPRYLMPVLPYFYLAGAWSLTALVRGRAWKTPAALTAVAAAAWSLGSQPFVSNAETSLRYLDVVRVQQEMCELVATRFRGSRVLTAWPHDMQLARPHLGYVERRVRTVTLGGRKVEEVLRASARDPVDLILVSMVPSTSGMGALRSYAVENGWRLVERREAAPVVSELYASPSSSAAGTVVR